jgi:hypothetical protein
MKPYYYVYRVGYKFPTVQHYTLISAAKEAERLSNQHPGEVFEILQCLATIEAYPCRHCGEVPEWVDIPMGGTPPWDGKLTHKCLSRSWSLIGGKEECLRDWNEVYGRSPLAGWIYAKCDTCGDTWRETSRDIKAVSSVECANGCEHGGDTHVWKRERCFLPTDRSGNLREYTKERLSSGLGRNTLLPPVPDNCY